MLLSPQQCQVWRFQWLRAVCCVPAYIAQEKRHIRYTKQCRWTINTFFHNGMKSPLSLIPHQKSKNVISLFTNGFTLVLEVLMPHWKCISPQCLGGSWSRSSWKEFLGMCKMRRWSKAASTALLKAHMPDQSGGLLWWGDWDSGQGKTDQCHLPGVL